MPGQPYEHVTAGEDQHLIQMPPPQLPVVAAAIQGVAHIRAVSGKCACHRHELVARTVAATDEHEHAQRKDV